jgi:hypothetical protein
MSSDQEERVFHNVLEASRYLKAQGYKVSKSKVYADTKEGRLQVREGGRVYLSDLMSYVSALGLKRPDVDGDLGAQEEKRKKEELERKKLELEVQQREFALQKETGQFIPRADFELELASRAGVLDNGLRTAIKTHARDWVYMVGGRAERVPDLIEAMLGVLDQKLNEYARMDRFEVVFTQEESEQEDSEQER